MNIIALMFEGKPIVMFRTNEVTVQSFCRYRYLEAVRRHVSVNEITVAFEGEPTVEQKNLMTEDLLSVRPTEAQEFRRGKYGYDVKEA